MTSAQKEKRSFETVQLSPTRPDKGQIPHPGKALRQIPFSLGTESSQMLRVCVGQRGDVEVLI